MNSDNFSRQLQRRVTQLRKLSREAVAVHQSVTAMVKAECANELQMQLDNYKVWQGWKLTGSNKKSRK